MRRWLVLALVAPLAGCATVSTHDAFTPVADTVQQRTGQRIHWRLGSPEDAEVSRRVDALLGAPLTADTAVEIALLENPSLQATYEELGVAQADLVQAGLLRNPTLFGSVQWPNVAAALPKLEFSIAQEFIDLFLIPLRQRVAEDELDRARFRVAHAVLSLSGEVREAFYTLQASQQLLAVRRMLVEASEASAELARRQRTAGNISELDLASEEAMYQQERLDVARAEAEVLGNRERMNRLLGLWGRRTEWTLADKLPELPAQDPSLERLETTAIAQRLDLAAARKETEALERSLGLARGARWIGSVEVGAITERDSDGQRLTGPSLSVEVPLFDQHQASIARLEAQWREARWRQDALAVEIRSEARAARSRLLSARAVSEHYRTVLLPLRERIVALSQQHYNAMTLGVYQLLAARQGEVNAYREYIESVRDYWIARSDLERVLGGRLPPAAPETPSQTRPSP